MQELEEAVLAVGSWFSKIDDGCVVVYDFTFLVDSFSVAFHVELLDVGGKFAEGLAIGDDGSGGVAHDGGVVKPDKA